MRRYEDGSYYFEDYAPYDREHWTLLLDAIAWLTPLVGSEIAEGTPYGVGGRLACRFIEHALDLAPVVAMLLRVTRTHLFGNCAAFDRKIVLLDRIVWFEREGAAGPSDNHAWYLWKSAPSSRAAGHRVRTSHATHGNYQRGVHLYD